MISTTASPMNVVDANEVVQPFGQKGFQRIRLEDLGMLVEEPEEMVQDSRLSKIVNWVRDLIG